MTIFVCGPDDVMPGGCPECGGWLHSVRPGGFDDPGSMRVCSEECIDSAQEHRRKSKLINHLRLRDMMCDCAEVCAPAGLPSEADRAEWATYEAEHA